MSNHEDHEGQDRPAEDGSGAVRIEVQDAEKAAREAAAEPETSEEDLEAAAPGDGEDGPEAGDDQELSLLEALEARMEAVSAENAALRSEVELAEAKAQEAENKLLRLQADFQNFRRRKSQEVERLQDERAEKILLKALPVLDDLGRAIKHVEKDQTIEGVVDGLILMRQKFEAFLNGQSVQRIEAEGKPFDPNLHDAMVRVPIPEGYQDEDVVEVFEEGYLFGERVLRHAKVSVAKAEAEADA